MLKHFQDCHTVEAIKTRYRELARSNHPDLGGDTATMQQINAAYQQALKNSDGQTSPGSDGKEHVYRYNENLEAELIEVIGKTLSLKMQGVEVWLIGTWIWAIGDTKPYKEALGREGLGYKWNSGRACWYYHVGAWTGRNSSGSLGDLADRYGAQELRDREAKKTKKLAHA